MLAWRFVRRSFESFWIAAFSWYFRLLSSCCSNSNADNRKVGTQGRDVWQILIMRDGRQVYQESLAFNRMPVATRFDQPSRRTNGNFRNWRESEFAEIFPSRPI